MTPSLRRTLLLAAVTLPLAASMSLAQYRIDNGSARDANNRIGSGGFNTGGQLNGRINGLAGNYIVTGNVTAGRSFRGSVGYTDQSSFRGSLGSASFDNFYRDSIGVSQMRGTAPAANNFATIQPYYGAGTVAPPSGFGRDPTTGAFYLQPPKPNVEAGDGRIDYGGATRADLTQGILSTQRATGGAGLVNSPFSAVNQRDQLSSLRQMSDYTALGRRQVTGMNPLETGPRLPQLPVATVTADGQEPKTDQLDQPLPTGLANPNETTEDAEPKSPTLTGQGAMFKNLRALDNNTQYAELRKRFEDTRRKQPKLPGSESVESLAKVNAELQAQKAADDAAKAAKENASPEKTPANAGEKQDNAPTSPNPRDMQLPDAPQDTLNLPRPTAGAQVARPRTLPLEINSLSVGVKDAALGKLLTDAEAAMKAGKFGTAIEIYDQAEAVSSDDPLIFMGRSIAELGGSYYRSAEIHLRQAFAGDEALLLAKFDLRTMLTDMRLNFLQNDLAQIARTNEKDSGPLLLLAFIYYNTGFPERSERALEMAQERAGGNDPSVKALSAAWFPKDEAAPEMSK